MNDSRHQALTHRVKQAMHEIDHKELPASESVRVIADALIEPEYENAGVQSDVREPLNELCG